MFRFAAHDGRYVAAIVLFILCFLIAVPAVAARTVSTCGPDVSGVLLLNADSLAALTDVTYDEVGLTPTSDLVLTFAPQPPQLVGSEGKRIVILPTALLPLGLLGEVLTVDTSGPGTMVLNVSLKRRPPGQFGVPLASEFSAEPGAARRSCAVDEPGIDTDGDDVEDSGTAHGNCDGNNGADYGFRLEVADGVEINGVVTAAPFDLDGGVSISKNDVSSANVNTSGRISFTGEISATADTELGETFYDIGSAEVGRLSVQVLNVGSMDAILTANFFVGVCGNISAGTHAGVTATAATEFGLDFIDADTIVTSVPAEFDINVSPPQLDNNSGLDITVYGGADLTLTIHFNASGFIPVAGSATTLTALGAVRTEVDPLADPWWQISGRPEVYLDVSPQLFTADLASFDFDIVIPNEQVFFTSNQEFPFNSPAARQALMAPAAGAALRWSRAYQSADHYASHEVNPLADGGAILVGSSVQFGTAMRVDYQGNLLWQQRFEGGFIPETVHEVPNGNILIGGVRAGGVWLLLLDADGNMIWSRELAPSVGAISSVVIADVGRNGVLLGGEFIDVDAGVTNDFEPWGARIDRFGNLVWARYFGQDAIWEEITDVVATSDGGLLVVGESEHTPDGVMLPGSNAYTLRIAADGTVGWSNVWASSSIDRPLAATQAPDGSFLVVGSTGGIAQDTAPRGLAIRYDSDVDGAVTQSRWVRGFGTSFDVWNDNKWDELVAVVPSGQGFVLAGTSRFDTERKAWIAKINEMDKTPEEGFGARVAEPDMVWSVFHDGLDREDIVSLHDLGDGFLLGGHSASFAGVDQSNAFWITRMPYDGFLHWNGISGASAQYTSLLEDEPPTYDSIFGALGDTAEEDTSALEQQVDFTFTVVDSTLLNVVADEFTEVELVRE